MSKWGVIYSARNGILGRNNFWHQIQEYLDEKNVKYTAKRVVGYNAVEAVVPELVGQGCDTIIIVGGDSALNCVIKGIVNLPSDVSGNIKLGIIPHGIGNDFVHFWRRDNLEDYKSIIDALLECRIRKIDIGFCEYTVKNGSHECRPFVNCVNVGLTAQIINLYHRAQRFWGVRFVAFIWSTFLLLFQRKVFHLRMHVNDSNVDTKIMTLCIGNCKGYGQTPSAVPYNGWLDVSIVNSSDFSQMVKGIWLLSCGRFLNHENVYPFRSKSIQVYQAGKANIALDGYVLHNITYPLTITIKQELLNFIIPGE